MPTSNAGHRLLAVGAIIAATAATAGCVEIRHGFARAWAVTYEISTPTGQPVTLTGVTYAAAKRGEQPVNTPAGTVRTHPLTTGPTRTGWTQDVVIDTTDTASVTATPPAGVAARCRILLDKKRVIADQTGAPGAAVNCVTRTPDFG